MTDAPWPAPPAEAVFHGPAGEFVLRTEPHTESHPMALLSQFLVAFGTATGNSAHYAVEASRHHSNEFIVLVGPSSKGRKGSSWDHVEALIRDVDEPFVERCIASGMSSGEGLIAEVADDNENGSSAHAKAQADRRVGVRAGDEGARPRGEHTVARDPQRLGRQDAADDGQEQPAARDRRAHRDRRSHHQARAAAPHHRDRTREWILQPLHGRGRASAQRRCRSADGSAEKNSTASASRSGSPPASPPSSSTSPSTLARGRGGSPSTTSSRAASPDSRGAATARAEAHAVRLALLYALLDCSPVIGLQHLEAALAFWGYSAASARWVFGDSIGDPTADEIWVMARERHDGITRTEVSNLFSRNKKAREIDRALQALIDAGRLERATIRDPQSDRTLTVWRPPTQPARTGF